MRTYDAGAVMSREGAPATHLLVLVEGGCACRGWSDGDDLVINESTQRGRLQRRDPRVRRDRRALRRQRHDDPAQPVLPAARRRLRRDDEQLVPDGGPPAGRAVRRIRNSEGQVPPAASTWPTSGTLSPTWRTS
jgi:hypothetical protein